MTGSKSSSVIFRRNLSRRIPALVTRMSSRPMRRRLLHELPRGFGGAYRGDDETATPPSASMLATASAAVRASTRS